MLSPYINIDATGRNHIGDAIPLAHLGMANWVDAVCASPLGVELISGGQPASQARIAEIPWSPTPDTGKTIS